MPDTYSGKPANVEFNLPEAASILSTTNATPIVVTTASPHKCNSGDYLIIIGAQDPNANGVFRAGTVTDPSTVALLTRDGFNTTGSLVGGAQGTLQQAGYGATVSIVAGSDRPSASSVNVPFSVLLDRVAWLEYAINFGRLRRRPSVILTASSQTIDTSMGDCFVLPGAAGVLRTITLRNGTDPEPMPNERIEISIDGPLVSGRYDFNDQAGSTVASIRSNVSAVGVPSVTFELNGTPPLWKLRQNSGFDSSLSYGVRGP